jgi:ribosomal peptide maturation radical SAM protein 1
VVVRGPGEPVITRLCRALLAGEPAPDLPGLVRRTGGELLVDERPPLGVSMDDVPAPMYDDFFAQLRTSPLGEQMLEKIALPFEGARGCWWGEVSHCTFCGLNGNDMRFREKRADTLYDELMGMVQRHGISRFTCTDNILSLQHLRKLMPRLRDSGVAFDLFYELKPTLRPAELRLLFDAGVHLVQPGIESLSTAVLKIMGKGATGYMNIRFLKWCTEAGIVPIWNLLYNFGGEPLAEYHRIAKLIPKLTHLHGPAHSFPVVTQRFSPMFERPAENGIRITGPFRHYRLVFPFADDKTLWDLAYRFRHERLDPQAPDAYAGFVETALAWRGRWWPNADARPTMTCASNGDRVTIIDGRQPGGPSTIVLDGLAAHLHEAAGNGGRAGRLATHVGCSEAEATRILDELTEQGLCYAEDGRYLALALRPRVQTAALIDDEPIGPAEVVQLRARA